MIWRGWDAPLVIGSQRPDSIGPRLPSFYANQDGKAEGVHPVGKTEKSSENVEMSMVRTYVQHYSLDGFIAVCYGFSRADIASARSLIL